MRGQEVSMYGLHQQAAWLRPSTPSQGAAPQQLWPRRTPRPSGHRCHTQDTFGHSDPYMGCRTLHVTPELS